MRNAHVPAFPGLCDRMYQWRQRITSITGSTIQPYVVCRNHQSGMKETLHALP